MEAVEAVPQPLHTVGAAMVMRGEECGTCLGAHYVAELGIHLDYAHFFSPRGLRASASYYALVQDQACT